MWLSIPDRRSVVRALARGEAAPVALVLPAAAAPPLHHLAQHLVTERPWWLLESARYHPTAGRYSYLAWTPTALFEHASLQTLHQVLARYPVRRVAGLPPFLGGAIGYVGYECRHAFESLPQRARRDLEIPDCSFALYETFLAIDHLTEQLMLVTVVQPDGAPAQQYAQARQRLEAVMERVQACPPGESGRPVADAPCSTSDSLAANMDPDRFTWMVRRALKHIAAGDIYQANVSVRWEAQAQASPWQLYQRLCRINPSPYASFADLGRTAIVSCSPELLLRIRGSQVITRPIAGTRPRGATPEDDLAQAIELILSDKERAEHVMLVDLERNDLGRVCRYGSVLVDELMTLEDYSHVIHIVSNVRGTLRPGADWWSALAAIFPGGTITGCPKIRAMEIIDALEPTARGIYTGSLGWISYTGDVDFNIAIRTMVVHDGRAYIQAGAGIVADSRPEREYAEVQAKAQALIEALAPLGMERPAAHMAV